MKQHIVFPDKITDGGVWSGRSGRPSPSIAPTLTAPIRYYFTHHKVKVPESVPVPSQSHRRQEAWNTRGCTSSSEFTCENVFPRRPSSPERTHGSVIALERSSKKLKGSYLQRLPDCSPDIDVPGSAPGWLPLQSCRGEYLHLWLHVRNVWERETREGPWRGFLGSKKRRGHIITSSGSFIYMLLTI